MATGIDLIVAERERQLDVEGWTPKHDDEHEDGEMALAAACYASPVPLRAERYIPCHCREASCEHAFGRIGTRWSDPWPWGAEWDKRGKHSRLRQLAIAGALIAAEIDRLQRKDGVAAVICTLTDCRTEGPIKDSESDAIAAWNTRADHIAELEKLREALRTAIELFEADDECNKVGTDAWVWLKQARAALEES